MVFSDVRTGQPGAYSVSYVDDKDLHIETEKVIVSLKDGPEWRASTSWDDRLAVTVRNQSVFKNRGTSQIQSRLGSRQCCQ